MGGYLHPNLDNFIQLTNQSGGYNISFLTDNALANFLHGVSDSSEDEYADNFFSIDRYKELTSIYWNKTIWGNYMYYTLGEERVLYHRNLDAQFYNPISFFTAKSHTPRYLTLMDEVVSGYPMGQVYYIETAGNNNKLNYRTNEWKTSTLANYVLDYSVAGERDIPMALTKSPNGFTVLYNLHKVPQEIEIKGNTDMLGYLPSVSMSDQESFSTPRLKVYTEFDDNGVGNLNLITTYNRTTTLIESQPIVGKISMTGNGDYILFYTLENSEIRIKVYDVTREEITDLTDILKSAIEALN